MIKTVIADPNSGLDSGMIDLKPSFLHRLRDYAIHCLGTLDSKIPLPARVSMQNGCLLFPEVHMAPETGKG